MPPMPSARSRVSAPVGITEISSRAPPCPRRMMAPLPNWRSMEARASSRAWRRSLFTSAMGVSSECSQASRQVRARRKISIPRALADYCRGPIPPKSMNGALRRHFDSNFESGQCPSCDTARGMWRAGCVTRGERGKGKCGGWRRTGSPTPRAGGPHTGRGWLGAWGCPATGPAALPLAARATRAARRASRGRVGYFFFRCSSPFSNRSA